MHQSRFAFLATTVAVSITLGCAGPPEASNGESEPLFVDATEAAGLDFVHHNGMSGQLFFSEVVGAGAGLFDADNDGDLDLYLVQGHDLPLADGGLRPQDRILRNDSVAGAAGSDGPRFTDVTEGSGLEANGYGMGVAIGDVDNDGFPDVYLTNHGANQLWRNTTGEKGRISFENVTESAGVGDPSWSTSASFVDLDADGWLDLYVVNYVDYRIEANKKCRTASRPDYCGPVTYPPASDRLFINRGLDPDGQVIFEDISGRAGILDRAGAGLGVVATDVEGDGDLDLYVANDQDRNLLWLNQGDLQFTEDALLSGCAANGQGIPEASMGVDTGDLDNDGDEDLFMTHLRTETNTLFLNDGSGFFADHTAPSGVGAHSFGTTGFGTVFMDLENDGWLDLILVNGAVTLIEEQLAAGEPHPLHQPNQILRNQATLPPRFEEVTAQAGQALSAIETSRGLAAGDVDNDGDLDLIITNNNGRARLLLNSVGHKAPWLGLRLIDPDTGSDIPGTRVIVRRAGAPDLSRRVKTDGSFLSAHDPRVLFGLGDGENIEEIEVQWPGGEKEIWPRQAVGKYSTLIKGQGTELAGDS